MLAAMMALASSVDGTGYGSPFTRVVHENRAKKSTPEEINKANGLKEFTIEGKVYWAINYKNAVKKYNKEKGSKG